MGHPPHQTEKRRILVIEDEIHIAEGLKLNLELKGYEVELAQDGINGLTKWKERQPDLIVLDIMLPGMDGLSVLRHIRLIDEFIPILILSAKGDSSDKVKGFSYGVDDYLAKPFNLEEFLLRVERLLIRAPARKPGESPEAGQAFKDRVYTFGDNRIDFGSSIAHGRTGPIHLTELEVKLLKLFIINPSQPISRGKLLEIGWGYTRDTKTRTVDNFIVRFRKYFEKNPKKPVYFKSVRSKGYVFNPEP